MIRAYIDLIACLCEAASSSALFHAAVATASELLPLLEDLPYGSIQGRQVPREALMPPDVPMGGAGNLGLFGVRGSARFWWCVASH